MILSKRVDFSSGLDYWPPDVRKAAYLNQVIYLGCFARDRGLSSRTPTAIERSKQVKANGARSRDGLSGQKARESSIYFVQGDLVQINVTHIEHLTSTPAIV